MKNYKLVSKARRQCSVFTALSIIAAMFPSITAFAEPKTTIHSYDGYDIAYTVLNEWDNGQSVELKITNTGEESILNWAFQYDAGGEISNLWNASVVDNNNTEYVIKNSGWNYEIAPNQSVNFGYNLTDDDFVVPYEFELCSERVEALQENYITEFVVNEEWDTGFQGEIVITNTSSEAIEAWKLAFDSDTEITNIWNGRLIDKVDGRYSVGSEMWSNPIAPNSSVRIGIMGEKNAEEIYIGNFQLSCVVIGDTKTDIDADGADTNIDIYDNLIISAFGGYIGEKNMIDISWFSTNPDGIFEVLTADDNNDYTVIASVSGSDSCSIAPDLAKKYIKVKQSVENHTAESETFTVTQTSEGYVIDYIDTDSDRLYDYIEEVIGTDKSIYDTDKDGLSDYEEIAFTNTDPLIYSSVEESLSDAEADSDKDGVSNIEEIRMGTEPLNMDSDSDSITDGDEINTYGTNPLEKDSDYDNLYDKDELALSTDPLNPDTNGNGIPDGDELYTVEISEERIDISLMNDNEAIPSLTVTAKGNANTSVQVAEYTGNEQSNSLCIGKTIVISGNDIEGGALSFEVSNDEAFAEYEYAEGVVAASAVICYNNGTETVPLATSIDAENKTISANIKSCGTYFVANIAKVIDEWGVEVSDTESTDTEDAASGIAPLAFAEYENFDFELGGQADIVFIVDVTGSMRDTISNVKKNIAAFAEEIESAGIRPNYALIEFGDIITDGKDSTKTHENGSSEWFHDIDDFKEALNNLGSTWGGDTPECVIDALAMASNLDMRDTAGKYFILVTDASYKIANNYGYTTDTELFNDLAEKDISVSVATGTGIYSYYHELINTTDGICCNIYGNFSEELLKISEFISEKTNDGYWIALNGKLPYVIKLEDNPFLGESKDTDRDGLKDNEEITQKTTFKLDSCVKAALAASGIDITSIDWCYPDVEVYNYTSNPLKADSDDDGLLDGDYQRNSNNQIIAPIDANKLDPDGPTGMWLAHIEAAREDVPVQLEQWYGETQYNNYSYIFEWIPNNYKNALTGVIKNSAYGISNIAGLDTKKAAYILDVMDWRNYINLNEKNSGIEGFDTLIDEVNALKDTGDIGVDCEEVIKGLAQLHALNVLYNNNEACAQDVISFFEYIGQAAFSDKARASLGSRFLNFKVDKEGVIHSQHRQWQAIGGYNNGYDAIFRTFTGGNMDREKFSFTVDDMEYILWAWRGDYLNLGAGAEVGIYSRPTWLTQNPEELDHYFTDYDLALPMTLSLYNYNSENDIDNIYSWFPQEDQWWITGFNPEHLRDEVDVNKQVMIASVDFSGNEDMYNALEHYVTEVNEKIERFTMFDSNSRVVWLCWYKEGLLNEKNNLYFFPYD